MDRPQTFLNEARLSALALAIYLAGRQVCADTLQADTPRLMVLDDVLIGLDQSNRLPVLARPCDGSPGNSPSRLMLSTSAARVAWYAVVRSETGIMGPTRNTGQRVARWTRTTTTPSAISQARMASKPGAGGGFRGWGEYRT